MSEVWQIVEVLAPRHEYEITFEVAGHRMTTLVKDGPGFERRARNKLDRMARAYLRHLPADREAGRC